MLNQLFGSGDHVHYLSVLYSLLDGVHRFRITLQKKIVDYLGNEKIQVERTMNRCHLPFRMKKCTREICVFFASNNNQHISTGNQREFAHVMVMQ